MSLHRQNPKRDFNEASIVAALRQIGVDVFLLSSPGLPDLLTYSRGVWLPIEVKRPRGHLTPLQAELRQRIPFPVVETVAEAMSLFGVQA